MSPSGSGAAAAKEYSRRRLAIEGERQVSGGGGGRQRTEATEREVESHGYREEYAYDGNIPDPAVQPDYCAPLGDILLSATH